MKKILFGCIAAASMLFAASCAKESEKALPGEALEVTFDVSLQSAHSTRAISDGNTVDKLTYKVYNTAGEAISGKEGTADIANGSASVKISLIQGQTYQFVFWAQKGDTYDLSAFPTVKVNYTNVPNNDESRDAFYFAGNITIDEVTKSVELHRPFAQINFGVIYDKEVPVTKSYMNVKSGAYSQIDLLTGKVSEEVKNIGFTPAAIPTETLKANGKEYTYLSMDYVLVPEDGSTLDLSFDFDGTFYDNANVPAKMNHRTNLLAEVTAEQEIDFNITVVPDYDEEGDTDIIIEGEGNGEEPGGEEPGEETTKVYTITFSELYTEDTELTTATAEPISVTFAKGSGSSAPKYYANGTSARVYAGNTFKVSAADKTIVGIELIIVGGNENAITTDKESFDGTSTWTGSEKEVTFTIGGGTSGHRRIGSINVTVLEEGSSTEPEEPEEPATVTVSNVKAEYADGKVKFSANYDGKKDAIKSAAFVYGPATRAASEGEVAATIGEGVLTATATLEPGNYTVSVKINGEPVESTTADQDEVNIEVPEGETPEQPEEAKAVSVADFNAAPESDTQVYELVGKITGTINTQYGNFDLEDETGSVYVYGLTATNLGYGATNDKSYASLDLAANDKIKIQGYRGSYNGKIEVMYAWFIEVVEKAPVIETFEVDYNADANTATFTATYTNKGNVSLKAGFTYEGTSGSVDVPATAADGTFTATIDTKDLAYGSYKVIAYVNDIKSTSKSFTIKDPNAGGDEKESVTVTFDKSKLAAAPAGGTTVTMDNVISFTNSSSYGSTVVTELRIYKNATLTLSAASGYEISKIELTCDGSGTGQYGPGNFTAQDGYTYEGKIGTWEGASDSVAFTASVAQVRITEMTVTYHAK